MFLKFLILTLFSQFYKTSAQILNPVEIHAKLPTGRSVLNSVIYDGLDSIYIFGGFQGDERNISYSKEIIRFNVNSYNYNVVAVFSMGTCCGSVIKGKTPGIFYYFGGETNEIGDMSTVYRFDANNGIVSQIANLPDSMVYPIIWNFDDGSNLVGLISQGKLYHFNTQTYETVFIGDISEPFYRASGYWDGASVFIYGIEWADSNTTYTPQTSIEYNHSSNTSELFEASSSHFFGYSGTFFDRSYGYFIGGLWEGNKIIRHRSRTFEIISTSSTFPGGRAAIWDMAGVAYVPKLKRVFVMGGGLYSFADETTTFLDKIWIFNLEQNTSRASKLSNLFPVGLIVMLSKFSWF